MNVAKKKLLFLFVLVLTFSFSGGIISMNTDNGGDMNCPFMGMDIICQMGFLEHISTFQDIFASILAKNIFFFILTVFLIINLTIIPKTNSPPNVVKFLMKECSYPLNFNKILLALSDGIIQSKLYV